MPSIQGSLNELLGSFGALLLIGTTLLLIFTTPVMIVLSLRFLWRPRVALADSRALADLTVQLHRIASALESGKQPTATELLPESETLHTPVHLSMFGR